MRVLGRTPDVVVLFIFRFDLQLKYSVVTILGPGPCLTHRPQKCVYALMVKFDARMATRRDYEHVRPNVLTSGNVKRFRLHPLTCRIYREVSSRPVAVSERLHWLLSKTRFQWLN
jgi:hypothetical protein